MCKPIPSKKQTNGLLSQADQDACIKEDDGSLVGTALHAYAILRGNELLEIFDSAEDALWRADGYKDENEGPISIRLLDITVMGEEAFCHPDDDLSPQGP